MIVCPAFAAGHIGKFGTPGRSPQGKRGAARKTREREVANGLGKPGPAQLELDRLRNQRALAARPATCRIVERQFVEGHIASLLRQNSSPSPWEQYSCSYV